MALIDLENVSVDFPIYSGAARSLKQRVLQVATGGRLGADAAGRVVVRALDGLSFTLRDGDRVGLVGHNGAGKSTLLRLLNGVYAPTAGGLRVEGEPGSLIDIGLGIDPDASGRDNILVRAALLGIPEAEVRSRMEEIVAFSELGDFIDLPVRTYSSGMHLRLAFSVSTMVRPEILLMDEWLSVGDQQFGQKARERLDVLVQSSAILVLATHSRELVLQACNRAIWLEHGRVRLDGAPAEVCEAYFGPGG